MPSVGASSVYTPSFSSAEPYDTRYYEYAHLDDPKHEQQQRFGPPVGVASEAAFWEEESFYPSLDLPQLERIKSMNQVYALSGMELDIDVALDQNLDLNFSSDDESSDKGLGCFQEGQALSQELTSLSFGSPLPFPKHDSARAVKEEPKWMLPEAAEAASNAAAQAAADEASLAAHKSNLQESQKKYYSSISMSTTTPLTSSPTTPEPKSATALSSMFESKPRTPSVMSLTRLPSLEAPQWPDATARHDQWAGYVERERSDRPCFDDPFDDDIYRATDADVFSPMPQARQLEIKHEIKEEIVVEMRARRPPLIVTTKPNAKEIEITPVKPPVKQGVVQPVKDLVVKLEEDSSSDDDEALPRAKVAKRRGRTRRCEAVVKIDKITEINVSLRALQDLPCDLYGVRDDDTVTCGTYTPAERRAKIERWQRKKEAIFEAAGKDRVIMYGCRKKVPIRTHVHTRTYMHAYTRGQTDANESAHRDTNTHKHTH
jgi:hypothetical protein